MFGETSATVLMCLRTHVHLCMLSLDGTGVRMQALQSVTCWSYLDAALLA